MKPEGGIPLQNHWIAGTSGEPEVFLLPLFFTDGTVPEWFLDLLSDLIHLKYSEVKGSEIAFPDAPFHQRVKSVLSGQGVESSEQEYLERLMFLVSEPQQLKSPSSD